MADPFIGKKIGQYELRAMLGQGGMAVVYQAYQAAMDRDVALKIVSKLITLDQFFLERFNREAAVASKLEHSNIVPVFEYGTSEDGYTYLAMRYLRGGSLAERLRQTPLTLPQIKKWFNAIANALDYAHQQNIIHRDIKPSNILLDPQGEAYLVDFGLARMIDIEKSGAAANITKSSMFMGTPLYMSPEQIEQRPLDIRSDLYSLGVVLYEMVTGSPPFTHESTFRVMQMHLNDAPAPPHKYRPELAPEIEQVVLKALEKTPARRYQSAHEMAKALSEAIERNITYRPTQPIYPWRSPVRLFGRAVDLRLLIGGLLLILLLTGATLLLRQSAFNGVLAETFPTLGSTTGPRPAVGTLSDLKLTAPDINFAEKLFSSSFIGMVSCSLSSDYNATYATAARTRAQELGIPFKLEDADNQAFRQPQIINSFIAQGAKGIIVCPLDDASIIEALDNAHKAGVIVSENADKTPPGGIAFTISNAELGKAAGDYAASVIKTELGGRASVAMLDYPDAPFIVTRANAMEQAVLAGSSNTVIVGRWKGGTSDNAEKSIRQALIDHPEINVILSINDAGSLGAVKVLREMGKKPRDVFIISIDAISEAKKLIRSGEYFQGSVDTAPIIVGRYGVDAIVKMSAGNTVPLQITLPLRIITKQNVDQ